MDISQFFQNFIDNHASSCPAPYAMQYLYCLRYTANGCATPSNNELASALHLTLRDITDGWHFLHEKGLAVLGDTPQIVLSSSTMYIDSSSQKRNNGKLAEAILKNPELASLYDEAQNIFTHPMTSSEIKIVFSLYDELGFSIPVIKILLAYVKKLNKISAKYIERVAISWKEQSVDTVDKAEETVTNALAPKNKTPKKSTGFSNFQNREDDYSFLESEYFEKQTKE